jgi:hypothetical protein
MYAHIFTKCYFITGVDGDYSHPSIYAAAIETTSNVQMIEDEIELDLADGNMIYIYIYIYYIYLYIYAFDICICGILRTYI